jgi:hypothetical protein
VGRLDQQPSEHLVTDFGHATLGIPVTGLTFAGAQAQVGSDRTALGETVGILEVVEEGRIVGTLGTLDDIAGDEIALVP